ncbi:MFS transporter [Kitasatospora brasiliensis]|uniref:MFS transporter n=1 Tax=Kitasatospora brasiliensis TaxID=3058040 RepID=UPI00292E692E|nr:MFS transporter [Kitasatospora sp. K002]
MPELIEQPARTGKTAPPTAAPGRWRQLNLLSGAMLVDNTEAGLIVGLFPVIRQALGLSLGALGILTAAGKLIGVVTTPLWVWAAQRWSRKGVLVICSGLWGVWGVALGFAQDFTQLLVLSTILAAGYAGAAPVVTELIGDFFEDRSRGRAVGLLYGAVALAASLLAALKGQLAGVHDGWRWGLWAIGAFSVVYGLVLWRWLRDPGRGAAEPELADLTTAARESASRVAWPQIVALLRIPSLLVLLVSRLLSGHLLVFSFGVVYLVDVYGFTTQSASIVLLPLGIGFFAGNLLGGFVGDRANRRSPAHGLPAVLQAAQIAFAVLAYFGTQFAYGGIGPYALLFGLMGLAQGVNPGINRPMVMAVVPPGLRAAAFTLYVAVFESVAWAAFGLGAGFLGDSIGLRPVFLAVLVVLMLVNGAFLTLLHRTYGRDVERMRRELDRQRERVTS